MTRTVRDLLEYGIARFEAAEISFGHGTTNALDEAAWLVLRSLGFPPHELEPHLDEPLAEARWKAARALLDRRVRTRKPAAYLLNEAWLGPHRFYVDERVIVPRSFIAELMLAETGGRLFFPAVRKKSLSRVSTTRILDLCTGSGCLAILAALKWPDARVDAADLSDDALAVARRNVKDYGLGNRVRLVQSDLFEGLSNLRYDLIISNPPYVKAASMANLPDEYRKEPELALASGRDGLDHTRTILAQARQHLQPKGVLMVEIGHNRKALKRARALPFKWPKTSAGAGYVFTLKREELP